MFEISANVGVRARVRDSFVSIFLVTSLVGCASAATAYPSAGAALAAAHVANRPDAAASAEERGPTLTGAVLDRAAFVRAVLENNPSIESARQSVVAARARVRQVGVLEDPMVEVGVAPLSVVSSKAPLGYEVAVSQKLPWFGKRALETTTTSAEAEAASADYESTRRDLALAAVVLYDQYYVAVRSLEINAQHVELMRAMQSGATAQFEAGRGSAQDALQAEAELAHMEHDSVRLLAQRDVTTARMNELLHRSPELPLPPPPKALPNASTDELSAKQLGAEAVTASSEIAAAKQHIKAEQAKADRAHRDAYPDFTLSASYNSMWDMPEHRFMLGLGFNLPLQGSRRGGAADEALATRAQFESEVAKLTDAARTRVFVAVKQLQESAHVLALFETRLLPLAHARIDAAHAGFTTSRNPFVAVLDAEKNLRDVELDYELSRAEYHGRRAELDRALGRIPGLEWKGESQ